MLIVNVLDEVFVLGALLNAVNPKVLRDTTTTTMSSGRTMSVHTRILLHNHADGPIMDERRAPTGSAADSEPNMGGDTCARIIARTPVR